MAIDGNNVLIGAQGDDTNGEGVGQAHLFDAVTGNLLQTYDDPTPTSGDQFGASVALDGNYILIGAFGFGQAHLFDAVTGNLLQTYDDPTPTFGDIFGVSVALDGNYILIGAREDDTNGINVGQAHLFIFPEPTTLLLSALAAVGLLIRRRKRDRSNIGVLG